MSFAINRLHSILNETTCQLRKGETVEKRRAGPVDVVEVYAMPATDDPAFADLERVDLEFLTVGVDKAKAESRRAELVDILRHYPQPDRLAGGPSYIEVGAEIGDQGAALQLFALGKVLCLWDVVTPASLGFSGDEARRMAGMGFVMMTGFRDTAAAP